MRKDKVRAYKLRREGKSYKQIRELLRIPLSTLASWFKDEEWSKEIKDRLDKEHSLSSPTKIKAIIGANKKRWAKIHQEYRETGEKEFEKLKDNPLFLSGIMLYWGEGNKNPKDSRLVLTNTDPLMIRLFYKFLIGIMQAPKDKINVWLLLYPDLADDMQKRFWNKATGVPLSQFKNSIYIKGKNPTKRLSYGVCNIYVSSRELKEKMLVWLDLCQKKMLG